MTAERRVLDAYGTPAQLAEAIVGEVKPYLIGGGPPDIVIEPSVGHGPFVAPIRAAWPEARVIGVDANALVPGLALCDAAIVGDWLTMDAAKLGLSKRARVLVIGNPPFGRDTGRVSPRTGKPIIETIWHRHVEVALGLTPEVAMLLRLNVLGGGRLAWWGEHPPARVSVVPERPSFTGDGTDAVDVAVVRWGTDRAFGAELGWLGWDKPKRREKSSAAEAAE